MQQAMELLDPAVAAWWQSPQIDGRVRSYDLNDYPGMIGNHSFGLVENGRAIVVVERQFTAGLAAQGIIWLAHSGMFLFPPDADFNFKSHLTPMSAAGGRSHAAGFFVRHGFDTVSTRRVAESELLDVDPRLSTLKNLNHPADYLAALAEAGFSAPPELSQDPPT